MKFGYKLMTEEHGPKALIDNALAAEEAGFDFVSISDHFHPWLFAQGHAPFAWSVLGAIAHSTSRIGIATGLTCPIIRYKPAVVAQMAATIAVMSDNRFTFAVGGGERLNETVTGDFWPSAIDRHAMLEEAIKIFRYLWSGEVHSWTGEFYSLDHGRLFDLPSEPIPLIMGVSGPSSIRLAAETCDGIMATEAKAELVDGFRKQSEKGGPAYAEIPCAFADSVEAGLKQAHETFRFAAGGWDVNAELPSVEGFEAATAFVRPDDMADIVGAAGPEVGPYLEAVQKFSDAGFDHLVLLCPGPQQQEFIAFFRDKLKPELEKMR